MRPHLGPRLDRVVAVERLLTATLGLIALIARFVWGLGSATFEPANFLAYLTIQSNIAFVILTVIAGIKALHGDFLGPWLARLRAVALTCTLTAGIVFAVIVRQSGAFGVRVDVPWSDLVLHFVLPLLGLADWIFVPRAKVRITMLVFVLGYTLVWGGLTILRGAFVDWYPYYFLDPRQVSGPLEFLVFSGFALAVFSAVGTGVALIPARAGPDRA